MKFEQTWKLANSIKDIPYSGTFLAKFNSSKGLQTTFIHGRKLFEYPEEEFPIEYCKIPEDNEVLAKFVSETFKSSGCLLGEQIIDWEGYSYTDEKDKVPAIFSEAFNPIKAITKIETTTTVSIQKHLFTNVSETVEFVGELTAKQKNILLETSGLKMSLEDFTEKFQNFLDERYSMSGAAYEGDCRWDNFIEIEYNENYLEYVK